jgi:hypothetical protein
MSALLLVLTAVLVTFDLAVGLDNGLALTRKPQSPRVRCHAPHRRGPRILPRHFPSRSLSAIGALETMLAARVATAAACSPRRLSHALAA